MLLRSMLSLVVCCLCIGLLAPSPATAVRPPAPGSLIMCVELPTWPPRSQTMAVPSQLVLQYQQSGTATPGPCEEICPTTCATAVNTVLSLTTLTQVQCAAGRITATASTGGGFGITPTACTIQGMTGQTTLTVPLAPVHHEACLETYVPVVEALGFACEP